MMSITRWTPPGPAPDAWDSSVLWNIWVSTQALAEIDLASPEILKSLTSIVAKMLPHNQIEIVLSEPTLLLPSQPTTPAPGLIAQQPAPRPADKEAIERRAPIEMQVATTPWSAADESQPGGGKQWVVIVPLLVDDARIGVIHIWSGGSDRPLSAEECQVVPAVADSIARTINAASRLEIAARMAREQERLLQVSQAAASSLALEEVLSAIAQAAIGLANAERCGISFYYEETGALELCAEATVANWANPDPADRRIELDRWPGALHAIRERRAVWSDRDSDQRRLLADYQALVPAASDVESLLLVPLLADEQCVGVVTLSARHRQAFGPHEAQIGETIGSYTVPSIRHARLLRDAQRYAAAQAAMLRVSRAASISRDFPLLIAEIARACLGIAGAEASGIYFWDPEKDDLEVGAEETVSSWPGVAYPGKKLPLKSWPTSRMALVRGETSSFDVEDPILDAAERHTYQASGIRSVLIVPVMLGTERLGLLELFSRTVYRFSAVDIHLAQELAAQAAHTLDRARLQDALQHRANTDGLTGLLNHRAIEEQLDHALTISKMASKPLAVLIADINDFKLFNDTHGHQVGDGVLIQTATILREVVGDDAHVGRHGGDEFLIVAPGLNHDGARQLVNCLLDRARSSSITVGDLRLPLKFSIGLATFPYGGLSSSELIAAADSEMYFVKKGGLSVVPTLSFARQSANPAPLDALTGLIRAVDRKDHYTRRHGDLVTTLAVQLAADLGLDAASTEALAIAGPLHDVGKIALPDEVLRKPSRLSDQEREMLRQHVAFGEALIHGVPHLDLVRDAIASHHERWDGTGYPRGLAGSEIPLLGRVLALADAYAAMVLDRPYRKGWPICRASAAIRSGAGSQFDPELTEPFIAIAEPLTTKMTRKCEGELAAESATEMATLYDDIQSSFLSPHA